MVASHSTREPPPTCFVGHSQKTMSLGLSFRAAKLERDEPHHGEAFHIE
jgi:hypothetical protein